MPDSLQKMEPDSEHSEIAFRKLIEKVASKDKPFRIVLSFREEYFLAIENFRDTIPTFFYTNGRYRLESFSEKESTDTIVKISRYMIDAGVAGSLSRLLSRIQAEMEESEYKEEAKNISPFILSLICKEIYEELKTDSNLKRVITEADRTNNISDFKKKVEKAIQNYYEISFASINEIAKIFIERKLISDDGKRTLFPYNDIKSYFKPENEKTLESANLKNLQLTADIDKLVEDSKIRYLNKNKYLNTTHIEILHDQLVYPVKKSRDERVEQEKEEKAQRDREIMLLKHQDELNKLRDAEEKRYLARQNDLTKANNRKLIIGGSLLAALLITIFIIFYNKTIQIIDDFAVGEERVVLDSKEKTQGTYAALMAADSFYSKIKRGLGNFKVPFSHRMGRLEKSIENLLINAYNKTPCFLIQELKQPYLALQQNYPKIGNLIYNRNGKNTLFSLNVINFKRDSILLASPRDSLILNLKPNQVLSFAQGKDFQSTNNHALLINQNNLYVLKIDDKLDVIYSIRLSNFPNSAEFSVDEKFIILSYVVQDTAKGKNFNRYFIIPLNTSLKSRLDTLEYEADESLITVVSNGKTGLTSFTEKLSEPQFNMNTTMQSATNTGWESLISSKFSLRRNVYNDGKIVSVESLYSGNIPGRSLPGSLANFSYV